MYSKLFKFITLIFIGINIQGCSSTMTRVGPSQGYYGGTQNSIDMLKNDDTGWVMKPLVALDLPFTAVLDTILIPYDYARSDNDVSSESPRERVKKLEQQE